MELECEAVKRIKLSEEHRWTALVEGDEGFHYRKQNKKKELDGEESKRKRSTETGSYVDTFGRHVGKRFKNRSCWYFVVASDEDRCEAVNLLDVSSLCGCENCDLFQACSGAALVCLLCLLCLARLWLLVMLKCALNSGVYRTVCVCRLTIVCSSSQASTLALYTGHEGHEESDYRVDPSTGWKWYNQPSHSSSSSSWQGTSSWWTSSS